MGYTSTSLGFKKPNTGSAGAEYPALIGDALDLVDKLLKPGIDFNLKIVRNASVNILDIFSRSGGAAPDGSNQIVVSIPDDNGLVPRVREAAYLSGTSQFTLLDAAGYWGRGSLNGSSYTAYLYAIWDGVGIVWAVSSEPGLTNVPTTVTVTDYNYFLLESSSTYVRNAAHYCICIGKFNYEYDTGDTPDHTINSTSFRFIKGGESFEAGSSRYKIGSFTYDLATASGMQVITGVGFRPDIVEFMAGVNASGLPLSMGWDDGTSHMGWNQESGVTTDNNFAFNTNSSVRIVINLAGDRQSALISAKSGDGFTLSWTKVGNPTGIVTILYKARR